MRFFKLLDLDGNIVRIDKCKINVCGGIEITEEEYNIILAEIAPPISDTLIAENELEETI